MPLPKFRRRWGRGSAEAWGPRRGKLLSKSRRQEGEDRSIKIYLAGNPNVGKSVIFNKLTGINVIVSNYPGTTVEVMQGTLEVDGQKVVFKDLPGIYSLGATSKDQEVAVRAILEEKPDVIINVVNAFNLERNLNLTLQLLELNVPVVIALNQVDFAAKRGILVDAKKLEDILGVPVIPTVAIHGKNIRKLLETALLEATIEHKREHVYHHHGLHHLHEHLHDVHHFHEEGTPLQLINEKINHKQETETPRTRFFRGFGRRRRRGILERAEISEMEGEEGKPQLEGESELEVPRGGMGRWVPHRHRFSDVGYSLDVERLIRRLEARITREIPTEEVASARVVAKWLLEGDWKAAELAIKGELSPSLRNFVSKLRREIEWRFGEKPETRISKERYALAGEIAKNATVEKSVKPSLRDRLDSITLSYYTGIPFLLMVVAGIFALLFFGGGFLEGVITSFFEDV
ncbi:MAG: 50S ribosome-binding GTPase, partial [Candidatus Freyarchaeota archaeon]|nr:50S ribosome-binding GTPase [Candidatus Jordarchaeia archaeon]